MKKFEIVLKIPMKAVCEEDIENWLDNFVIPDLIVRWSDGSMIVESEVKELKE